MQIVISEFETRCVELLDYVHASGEEIIVTMNGEPFVRVSGIVDTLFGMPQRVLGGQNGVVSLPGNQDSLIRSDLDNDWEASIP